MSSDEKRTPSDEVLEKQATNTTTDVDYDPTKWYNKSLPHMQPFSSGLVQTIMVSFVCFMCPGMFNALSGMGGAGLSSASLANKANTALYSTFATVGFFSGTIMNTIGPKYSLIFGGSGYSVYIASFLCYKHTENEGFIIFAGAWLEREVMCLFSGLFSTWVVSLVR
ncbi:unnamed protein product [Ambrosiozyma monospora]|uniref:Unnamed protein product n=1 Tax=Ambrosiozyma monospora TaxID=43982 RepID=A0ACB5TQF6_AMBMO|nr:unnamed protein product [Ambrosiozyma monospora]